MPRTPKTRHSASAHKRRHQRLVSLRRYHEKQIRIHRDVLQSAGLKGWRAWSKRQIKRHEEWLDIIKSIKPRSAG